MFQVEKTIEDGVLIFSLIGRLDTQTYQEIDGKLKEWLGENYIYMIGDFTQLEFISSAGLRTILFTAKQLKAKKGQLVLYGINEQIKQVLEVTGIGGVIPTTITREDALQRVKTS